MPQTPGNGRVRPQATKAGNRRLNYRSHTQNRSVETTGSAILLLLIDVAKRKLYRSIEIDH